MYSYIHTYNEIGGEKKMEMNAHGKSSASPSSSHKVTWKLLYIFYLLLASKLKK